jgi:hypothetical protein
MNQPEKKTRHVTLDKWRFEVEEYAEAGEVNLDDKKHQVGVGWVPHGGVVMRNVYHGGFRLAYDFGVAGLWVFPGPKARDNKHAPKYLVLGPPDFIQLDALCNIMRPSQDFDVLRRGGPGEPSDGLSAVSGMNVFNSSVKGELVVRWRSNYALFGKESGYLFVTQRFILTDYDAQPAHEPSGGLPAARLHPITEIHYEHPKKGYVESFRIDYRIYANLDSWWYERFVERPATPWLDTGGHLTAGRETSSGKIDNSAGLFRDDDIAAPIYSGLTAADIVFAAAEKPLKYEIIADGITDEFGVTPWDNVHWWGVNVKKGSVAPSAPGAFHALHMHWRWSWALQEGLFWVPKHAGESQFKGQGLFGTLVDPRIDKQKLKFAVVLNEGLPDDVHAHSSEVFEDFFKTHRGKVPEDIQKGGDLVLYYSVEVPAVDRSSTPEYNNWDILQGEVFVHGMFFAHEPEKSSLYAGAMGPMYKRPAESKVPKKWVRNPQI